MLRQYLEVKESYPDALVLYRMGDFFELFYDDAVTAAPVLEVSLTARNKGRATEAPMCGVPYHAIENYLGKLLRAGFKVAICDQVEDPAEAKGLVKRRVTRVATPGTVSEPALLDGSEESFLASVVWNTTDDADLPGAEDGGGAGAFLDVSTGRFLLRPWRNPGAAIEDLRLFAPREVVCDRARIPASLIDWLDSDSACVTDLGEDRWFDSRRAAEEVREQLGLSTLRGLELDEGGVAVRAAAAALGYARETQQSRLDHVQELTLIQEADAAVLDATTLTNLEIFQTFRGASRRGTLLHVLDRTVSPGGARCLRDWVRRPLRSVDTIESRLQAVAELAEEHELRAKIRQHLKGVGDPERILSRAVMKTVTPPELASLRDALEEVPSILTTLGGRHSYLLRELGEVGGCDELSRQLAARLVDEPSVSFSRGDVIRDGVSEELDQCRSLANDSKSHLLALEVREREATGISSLKVRFNKVFGYYLEVTKANQHLVPEHYVRKQTLVNAERYITPELKELEEKILAAEDRKVTLERELFETLRCDVTAAGGELQRLARALSSVDTLAGLAELAVSNDYVRPQIGSPGDPISIRDGRHPVVEKLISEPFVPNDAELDAESRRIVLLTGPNMGGKSTYLRQTALIVLMAQIGSFVPAEKASIGIVDRIFSRVGASDDLSKGESTFMVEMIETAKILHYATDQSLVILDEVGRGTATFDGLSLAWAIVEFLHEKTQPKTLFATHYHELTELSTALSGVVNCTLAVKEWDDRIVFLRRLVAGAADKSYGLHVARLAGIPPSVIARAGEVLSNLEAQEYDLTGVPRLSKGTAPPSSTTDQLQLFAPAEEVVASILRTVEVERLSPLAALNLLHSLKTRLG